MYCDVLLAWPGLDEEVSLEVSRLRRGQARVVRHFAEIIAK